MNRFTFVLAVALAAYVLAIIPDPASGCGMAPHHGQEVTTTDEAALIVWDDKTKTEHFIRRANFHSTGYDFGFLVPTPNPPDLDVAEDVLFGELSTITAPKIEYREEVREVQKEFSLGCASAKRTMEAAGMADNKAMPTARAPGGVEVLEQKRVGDYDAAVLVFRKGDGDDPDRGAAELAKWLVKHGYESSDAVKKWLERYVKDEWCITAFKIAAPEAKKDSPNPPPQPRPNTRHDLRSKPIRMSFRAERPFYPYREPESEQAKQTGEPRLLRVFVAASVRYAGLLGDGTKPWPGQTVWAGPVDAGRWTGIFQHAKLSDPPKGEKQAITMTKPTEGMWLTEFEDHSSPRPGTDEVYFEPAPTAGTVERPTRIITNTKIVVVTPWWHAAVYFGVPVAIILVWFVAWRLLRRV